MNVYIPSNLHFNYLFPDCIKQKDKYYYILHKIFEERIYDKRYNKDSFVNLHSHTLRGIVGERKFYAIRENLLNKGVIEINHSYLVEKFSKSYRLTDKYRNAKNECFKIEDRSIIQRIQKHKFKLKNDIHPEGLEYKFLEDNLNKIKVNQIEAMNFIDRNFYNENYKYNCYKIAIDKINDADFFFKDDKTGGRVYTNITNLPKGLRQFLSYDGQQLFNIDIRNSQPFLFNILIQNFFLKNDQNFILSFFNQVSSVSSSFPFSVPYSFPLYVSSSVPLLTYVVTFPDIAKYEELTRKGQLYEYLMEEMGIKEELRKDEEFRGKFKKMIFGKIFYCDSSRNYISEELKMFRKLFPTVSRIIKFYKKDNYKLLPINLQQVESDLIINKICKRIATERPEIFITTIHDSILTTAENKTYICNVMLNEFEKIFNLKPSIKIE